MAWTMPLRASAEAWAASLDWLYSIKPQPARITAEMYQRLPVRAPPVAAWMSGSRLRVKAWRWGRSAARAVVIHSCSQAALPG
jgi:hypothetical protein